MCFCSVVFCCCVLFAFVLVTFQISFTLRIVAHFIMCFCNLGPFQQARRKKGLRNLFYQNNFCASACSIVAKVSWTTGRNHSSQYKVATKSQTHGFVRTFFAKKMHKHAPFWQTCVNSNENEQFRMTSFNSLGNERNHTHTASSPSTMLLGAQNRIWYNNDSQLAVVSDVIDLLPPTRLQRGP